MTLSSDISTLRIEDNDLLTKNTCLLDEISIASDKTKSMLTEIHELKCKTNDLMQTVLKFTNGKKNLDMLIASQRISFIKIVWGIMFYLNPLCKRKLLFLLRACMITLILLTIRMLLMIVLMI